MENPEFLFRPIAILFSLFYIPIALSDFSEKEPIESRLLFGLIIAGSMFMGVNLAKMRFVDTLFVIGVPFYLVKMVNAYKQRPIAATVYAVLCTAAAMLFMFFQIPVLDPMIKLVLIVIGILLFLVSLSNYLSTSMKEKLIAMKGFALVIIITILVVYS